MSEYKFAQVDPNTCSIEELEKEVNRLNELGDYYETKQLAIKKFINSVYGATASKYFIAHNTAVAESITTQGQDLNHFSENAVNEYFSGIFQNDTELHKKLGIDTEKAKQFSIDKGKLTDAGQLTGDEFWYLNGNQSLTVAGDTDSCFSSSYIYLDNVLMQFDELFKLAKDENNGTVLKTQSGQEIIPIYNHQTLTYLDHDYKPVYRPIKYVMRHKIKKQLYKITTSSGKSTVVTSDHSIMIIRNRELMSIPTMDINMKTDKIITETGDK